MLFFEEEDTFREDFIQDLFERHPYLIDKRFLNKKIIPQCHLPSGFADIVVYLEKEIIVIELKVENLKNEHLLQLNGYLEDFQRKCPNLKISGILIGKEPKENIEVLIRNLNFSISIKILGKNVPIKIKICEYCRLANNFSNNSCSFCLKDI